MPSGVLEVRDKVLEIFLMILFGVGGIAVLLLALVLPMPVSERITTILIGSIGILWVLVRAVSLVLARVHAGQPR